MSKRSYLAKNPITFKDVAIGEPFDWIAPGQRNSFFERCYKSGPRKYRTFGTGHEYTVGSIHAEVFHVGLLNTYRAGF